MFAIFWFSSWYQASLSEDGCVVCPFAFAFFSCPRVNLGGNLFLCSPCSDPQQERTNALQRVGPPSLFSFLSPFPGPLSEMKARWLPSIL